MIKMDELDQSILNNVEGGATDGREARNSSSELAGQLIRTADTNRAEGLNQQNFAGQPSDWDGADFICIYFRGWDGALPRIQLLNAISCEMNYQNNNSRTVSYYNKEYGLSKSRLKDVLDLWSFIGLVDKRTEKYNRYSGNNNKIKYIMEELSTSRLLPKLKSYTTPKWSSTIESICNNIEMNPNKILKEYDRTKRVDWYGSIEDDEGPD